MHLYSHEINPENIKVVCAREKEGRSSEPIQAQNREREQPSSDSAASSQGHRHGHEHGHSHSHGTLPFRPPIEPVHRHGGRPVHAPPQTLPGRGGRLRPEREALSRLAGRLLHVWLKSGREFWFYPVYIGRTTVAGYAWKRGRWVYTGFSIASIEFFMQP